MWTRRLNVNDQDTMLPAGYSDMDHDGKVRHWVQHLYRAMRWAGEDGHDEISILDRQEIEHLTAAG